MTRQILAVSLVLAVGACASNPDPAVSQAGSGPAPLSSGTEPASMSSGTEPASMSSGAGYAPKSPGAAPAPAKASPTAAGWAVSIIGTPFALGIKTVVCAASLVVAAPVAGFLALGVDPSGEGYQVLGDGLAQNCGPPYVVSPYAGS